MRHLHICISVQKTDDWQRNELILVVLGNLRFLQVKPQHISSPSGTYYPRGQRKTKHFCNMYIWYLLMFGLYTLFYQSRISKFTVLALTRENWTPHFLHTHGTIYCWETGVHISAFNKVLLQLKLHWACDFLFIYSTSLAGLLSPPKCNNFFGLIHLSESCPLIPHYLGELMAFQVKQTVHPTLHSMWVTAMLSIMALGAA